MQSLEQKRKSKRQDLAVSAPIIFYSAAQWDAFAEMLERPEIDSDDEKPRLRKLLCEPSILER